MSNPSLLTLATIRIRLCLTQRELAARAGVSHHTISRIETSRHIPELFTRKLVAGALGIDPALIGWPTERIAKPNKENETPQ